MRRAVLSLTWAGAVAVAFLLGLAYAGDTKPNPAAAELAEVREQLALRYYRPVPERVLRMRDVQSIIAALHDPHTEYLAPFAYSELRRRSAKSYSGIGMTVLPEGGRLVVTAVAHGPARDAGLRIGDAIIAIDGTPTGKLTYDQALGRILGPRGTLVDLAVVRGTQHLDFRVRRAAISASRVSSRVLASRDRRVGYVGIRSFFQGTTQLLHRTIRRLETAGVGAFVLDLRDNTGGLLDQAIATASLFLEDGTLGSLESVHAPSGQIFVLDQVGDKTALPVVILVNESTASAAEIVAAALKDNRRAIVVGDATYGKALVQSIEPLPSGAALKITTARYLTPGGVDISDGGVTPDVPAVDDPATQEDETLAAALIALG
jgi:carboxyl-terminal processing protease